MQPEKSTSIVVRFAMTKGDGAEFPEAADFSADEREDVRQCLALCLQFYPEDMEEDQDARIISIEILYDGISAYGDNSFGYRFVDRKLEGYPAPIIRFHLDKAVSPEEFRRSIWNSSFHLKTRNMEEPFYAIDENGYADVLDAESVAEWLQEFSNYGIITREEPLLTLRFPDGLPNDSIRLPALEFARKP